MATLISAGTHTGQGTPGERRVAERLQKKLPQDWLLWWDVPIGPKQTRPDFVLLDMHLPDMGGLEVVRQLSEAIASRGLRISILTGDRHLSMDIIKAMSLGAYEYWVKPLQAAQFESGLRRALTGKRADPGHTLNGQRG